MKKEQLNLFMVVWKDSTLTGTMTYFFSTQSNARKAFLEQYSNDYWQAQDRVVKLDVDLTEYARVMRQIEIHLSKTDCSPLLQAEFAYLIRLIVESKGVAIKVSKTNSRYSFPSVLRKYTSGSDFMSSIYRNYVELREKLKKKTTYKDSKYNYRTFGTSRWFNTF